MSLNLHFLNVNDATASVLLDSAGIRDHTAFSEGLRGSSLWLLASIWLYQVTFCTEAKESKKHFIIL